MAVRRRAGALALAAALLLPTSVTAGPAPAAPAGTRVAAAESSTTLTVLVPNCRGCTLTAHSFLTSTPFDTWTQTRPVRNGVVTFRVPAGHTRGLSLTVWTPWEGLQGYQTKVAMRYAGAEPGSSVGFARARTQRQATGCWAGTTATRATLALGLREVRVKGLIGEVNGTIAWARTTQEWLPPMQGASNGVFGADTPNHNCEG
jgi:hypothetical protein